MVSQQQRLLHCSMTMPELALATKPGPGLELLLLVLEPRR